MIALIAVCYACISTGDDILSEVKFKFISSVSAANHLADTAKELPADLAWSVDQKNNVLRLTGSKEALKAARDAVSKIDIRPRQMLFTFRRLHLPEDLKKGLDWSLIQTELNTGPFDERYHAKAVTVSDKDPLDQLGALSSIAERTFPSDSNCETRVYWQEKPSFCDLFTMKYRANGDSSISIWVRVERLSTNKLYNYYVFPFKFNRRCSLRDTLLISSPILGYDVAITVREKPKG